MAQVKNGVNIATIGAKLLAPGISGSGYDFNPRDVVSKRNASAATIPFGRLVARNDKDSIKVIAADADLPWAMALYAAEKIFPAAGETGWEQNDTVPCAREGYFFVTAAENVAENDDVISITAGGGTLGSAVTGAAGAGRVAVVGAKWVVGASAGQVGVVYINFHDRT
jgi:hypothetical protein